MRFVLKLRRIYDHFTFVGNLGDVFAFYFFLPAKVKVSNTDPEKSSRIKIVKGKRLFFNIFCFILVGNLAQKLLECVCA
jgi:hypothetical protein